jgi:hypothetical protein
MTYVPQAASPLVLFTRHYVGDRVKTDLMVTCGRHASDEKSMQRSNFKAQRKGTTNT